MYEIRKSWWRKRWHVYEVGHTLGDEEWLASFRFEGHAYAWAAMKSGASK
jgi:hypothetical protein